MVHVHPMQPVNQFVTTEGYTSAEWERKGAAEALTGLVERVREMQPDCEGALLQGEPAGQVASLARTLGADLIVTASHHPSFLGRPFGLDQAPKVLHRASCPVLVYHEKAP